MILGPDDRGASELIGFIFIFGFIILFLAFWQAHVVPAHNAQVEFDHYVGVQDDVTQLRSSYIDAAESESSRSVTVQLGTTYPPRVLFINGPPPRGTLETNTSGNGTITADGLNVSNVCGTNGSVTANTITYDSNYGHFSDNETPAYNYENTVLYRRSPDGSVLLLSGQNMIQGKRINLYPLTNNFSENGVEAVTIDFLSARTGHKSLVGEVSLSIPTQLSAEKWAELLPNDSVKDTVQVNSNRVRIDLVYQAWEVQCAAIGVGETPDTSPPERSGAPVGTGGFSLYAPDDTTETLASAGGRWEGITATDQLILSNGKPSIQPGDNNLPGEVIRVTGYLNDSTGENFTIDVKLARASDGSWNKKEVKIYDEDRNSQSASLKADAAARIYEGGETDLLTTANYNSPGSGSGSFSDYVDQITRLDDDKPVSWQTVRMNGRVDVTFASSEPPTPPASGVESVNGTTPDSERSALLFDIQVANNTTKTITQVNITTPGNQNSNVQDANSLKRSGDTPEIKLIVSDTSGVNQSGERAGSQVTLDGTTYTLDTDAVFSDGAVISVDMGDIDGGSTKWKYDLVGTESNADVVITFIFDDGTEFEAYLRVTNVN